MPKQKLTICILGEFHDEPVARLAVLHAIKKCHAAGIPLVFCAEQDSNVLLAAKYEKLCKSLVFLSKLIKEYHLRGFFTASDGKPTPFFDGTKRSALITHLKVHVTENVNLEQFADELITIFAEHASKKLLEYLIENKLTYASIDRDDAALRNITQQCYAAASEQEQVAIILQNEEARIKTMTENIYEKAIKDLELTGGIVFCLVGQTHVKNLAASLSIKYPHLEITTHYCVVGGFAKFDYFLAYSIEEAILFEFDGMQLIINEKFQDIVQGHIKALHGFPPETKAKTLGYSEPPATIPSQPLKPAQNHAATLNVNKAIKYAGALTLVGLFGYYVLSKYTADTKPKDFFVKSAP